MAADGIHPITLGSIVSIPKNESGLILFDLSRFAASNRSLNVISKARCRVMPIGMVPKRPESQRRMSRNYQSKKCSVAITHFKGPFEGRQCLDKSRWIFVDHLLLNVPRISPWTGIGSANILTFFYIMEQSYQRTSTSTTSQHPR